MLDPANLLPRIGRLDSCGLQTVHFASVNGQLHPGPPREVTHALPCATIYMPTRLIRLGYQHWIAWFDSSSARETMQCGALQTSEGKHREQTPSLYS